MSKRQILRALQKKGLSVSECHYVNAAVAGGWCIELDSQSLDLLEDYGVEADDMYPVCDTAAGAMEWIASLPDCFDGASAA